MMKQKENKKIRTLSEVHPKLNKVKFNHLKSSIRSIPYKGNSNYSYLRFKEFVDTKVDRTKINISC